MRREDWFLVWMGLEVNIMSFLILIYRRYRVGVVESCMRYFFIQSLGSALFVVSFYLNYYLIGGVVFLVLRYKVGAGPFFYWFPSLCAGVDWISCYVLILFQKILPLLLISLFVHWILWFIVIVGLIVGVLGSFNQSNIKQLMAYSSIHHLGWIFLVMIKGDFRWILYLAIYGLVLFSVVGLLISRNIIDFSLIFICKNKLAFMLAILRMAGIPPLLGFFIKWMALVRIINENMLYLMMLVFLSVVILYVYIRIVYDVFIGGGLIMSVDYIFNKREYNLEMISVFGVVLGMIVGIILL